MLPEDDVAEYHDEDGRAEDDGGGVAHREAGETDEDARHGQAADHALNMSRDTLTSYPVNYRID